MKRTPKVLLVDDEVAILESTRLLLIEMGYHVVTAAASRDILPTLLRERPDLLLQDVRMPGLDLTALIAQMRTHPELEHVPVLLFSASMDVEEIAARVGASRSVEKPFRPSDLVNAIESALS